MPYEPIRTKADLDRRLVVGVTHEDHWLDFKAKPDKSNAENAGDVAQFSNASGGTLVFGATDRDAILTGFVGLQNPAGVIAHIERVVRGHLTPQPKIEPDTLEVAPGIKVVVVNVPPSVILIARHQNHEVFEFLIRGYESKQRMTLLEVEDRMQDHERRMRLRLGKVDPDASVRIDAPVHGVGTHGWRIRVVTDDSITLWINGLTAIVPLTYVEAVYSSGEPGAEWVLDLSCEMHARPNASPPHILIIRRRPTG